MNKQIKIFAKFPCNLVEICLRHNKQIKFSRSLFIEFDNDSRLYMTTEGDLLFTSFIIDKGVVLNLKNLVLRPYKVISVGYKRNSNDYYKELFKHNFNGSEKIYTCNFNGYIVYYIVGTKNFLWEQVIEEK